MLHALPLLAAEGVFTLSDRTEARVRGPDPITNAVALDLDTLMDARATWNSHSATYTLADLPRFTLLDYNSAVARQVAFLDGVLAAAEWRRSHLRILVSENASYGEQSVESLAALAAPGAPTMPGQPAMLPPAAIVPTTSQSIPYAASDTSAGTTFELRPWTLSAKIDYRLSGGTTAAAQQVLPFQQGPVAEVAAENKIDKDDRLRTVANASYTAFSIGTEDTLAQIAEQWRHRWARMTETLLGAGWYVARARTALDETESFGSSPIAEAALDQRFARGKNTGQIRADILLAPFINPLTGDIDEQIRGTFDANWTHRSFILRGFVSAGESVDQGTASAIRLATAEIDAAYKVSEWLTFDGGVRGLYEKVNGLGPTPPTGGQPPIVATTFQQGVVFVAVTVHAVKARL